jgi:hypothetical protein
MSNPNRWRVDEICSNVQPMTNAPNNPSKRPEDVVSGWLSGLPIWTYSADAQFYDALIFLRRRIQAMDGVQAKANKYLMAQDEVLLGLLKDRLFEMSKLANQPETKNIFTEIEAALRSRLLRSRADGRELTNMALTKLIFQIKNVEEKFLENGLERSGDDYKQLMLLSNQCKDLLRRLQEEDLLYKAFEPARSVLNAFKQQKSVVNEILNWYQIPESETDIQLKPFKKNINEREESPKPLQRVAENQEELFGLPVSSKFAMMAALRQAYLLYLAKSTDKSASEVALQNIIDGVGKISKIGTKGHEWEAFVSSAFDLKEPLFFTSRNLDKSARNFEVKLAAKLESLAKSIAESHGQVEATLAKAINAAKFDIELKQKGDVPFEIVMEPQSDIFQRICYQMPSIFRSHVDELWVDLAAEIYTKFGTRDFRVSIESKEPSLVTINLDFPTDLGSLRTEIHKFVRDNLQKLRVGLDLKIDR